jgi:hypothetical protein
MSSEKTTAKEVYRRASDIAYVGYECLTYCETLFTAIKNAQTLDQAKSIASVGKYLSADHANLFDCDHEQLTKECETH